MSRTMERLPVEPVLHVLADRGQSLRSLPERYERALYRARAAGGLTWVTADSIAIDVLGLHPCNVWGELWA